MRSKADETFVIVEKKMLLRYVQIEAQAQLKSFT